MFETLGADQAGPTHWHGLGLRAGEMLFQAYLKVNESKTKCPEEVPVGLQDYDPCWLRGCSDPSPTHSSAHHAVETVAQACRSFCLIFGHPMTFFHGRMLVEPKCLTESGNSQAFAGSHQFGELT